MDVFDLTARIALDTSEYENSLGKSKKSMSEYKSDVAKLAAAHKKSGMDSSAAWKQAYSEIDKSQYDTSKKSKETTEGMGQDWTSVAGKLKTVAKIIAGSAVVKGFADMTKASVDAYSSFEQLAGGARKIFDTMDVSKIFLDADRAYESLGLSANQYLATINDVGASFSATMGDERGYETAKTGLQAISDFASGTGKSVNELSQKFTLITKSTSSYQSIADQFSGILPATSAEFLNQAKAAGFLEDSYKSLTEVPIAKYQEAVAKMLEKGTAALGLAGNTAMEAATTISGSAQMAKAAWENWLVAVADPTQDLDAKTDALVDSLIAVADNAVPRVATVSSRLISSFVNSSGAVRGLVDVMEIAGVVMAGQFAGKTIKSVVDGVKLASTAVTTFTAANDVAAVSNAILSGELTIGQTVVGLLTGKISLATAAQTGWNAAMNANPIGLVITAVGLLGVAIGKSYKKVKELSKEFAGTAETSEEAAQKIEDLKAQIMELENIPAGAMTAGQVQEFNALNGALKIAQEQYDALLVKEQEVAAQTTLEEAAAARSEQMQSLAQSFVDGMTALMDDYQQTYSGILGSVQGWFGPFEDASVKVETSIDKMMNAMASQIEFNRNYEANLSALAKMGLGGLASAFQELGPQGAAYAQTIVDAVQKAGGATSEGGQQIIESFNTLNADMVVSESELSETMTTMSGKYDVLFNELIKTTTDGVNKLNIGDNARRSATYTLQGYLDGLNSRKGSIFAVFDEIRRKAESTLDSISSVRAAGGSVGGYATGLNYVPYDNFPALLHRGEAVLTAPEARMWRNGEDAVQAVAGGATIVINQYIQSVPQTPAEFGAATEAYFEQARWML